MSELIMGNYCFNTPSVNLCSDSRQSLGLKLNCKNMLNSKVMLQGLYELDPLKMNDLIYPLRQRESPLLTLKGSLVTGPGHSHPMWGSPWSAEWYVTWSNNGSVSLSCPSFYKPSIKPQQGRDKPWPTIMVFRVQSTAFLSFYGALLMLPLHWHYIFLMSRKIKLKYVKSTALLGNIKPGRFLVCCNKVWFLRLSV